MTPEDPRHGTRRGYYAHRRAGQDACQPCRKAAASAQARYDYLHSKGVRGRLRPHGVQRRLQALVTLGYTWERLDNELGEISRQSEKWAMGRMTYVFPSTHAKVHDLYERLSMTRAPETTPAEKRAASRSRNRASRLGWLPPMAWVDIDDPDEDPRAATHDGRPDPVVIDRILAGDWRLPANPAERREVIARWTGSDGQLERLTGWNVARDRRATRGAA